MLVETSETSLPSFERTLHQQALADAMKRLSRAWIALFPDTTRAGRHALISAIEQHLEGLSELTLQEELDLLGGSFRGRAGA